VFCERGWAEVNFETQSLVIQHQTSLPRRIVSATANFTESWKLSVEGVGNIFNYLRGRLVPYGGMQVLIPRLYESILHSHPPPISRELAIAVTQAEEEIFSGLTEPKSVGCYIPSKQATISHADRILVTGANGYVGLQVVKALVQDGYYVRALIRPTGSAERLKELGVEVFLGDVRRLDDVTAASDRVDAIVHLAAGMKGSREFILDTCVRGTRNVAEAALLHSVKRVLYMSSFSVYDFAKLHDGDEISEASPLEEEPERRGTYSLGKRRAEDVALAHLTDSPTPWTILRPSLIVGKERNMFAAVGPLLGNTLLCLGRPRKRLLLVHVEDVAGAILEALRNETTVGKVYIVSNDTITIREYVDSRIRADRSRNIRVLYVPYTVARFLGYIASLLQKLAGVGSTIDRRRLLSVYRDVGADTTLLQQHTGWRPMRSLVERLGREAHSREPLQPAGVNHPDCAASSARRNIRATRQQ
jgi:nucleoside-diphosphate-sugar epimerase